MEVLGQGGAGRVFRARREGDAEDVALKVLERGSDDFEENVQLLRNEADCARLVDHPNVVKILDLEEDEEGARLVMELMEGGSLHDQIVSDSKISEVRVLWMGMEILKALEAVSVSGLVHCDLKPANILFSAEGISKLGDFGLARSKDAVSLHQAHLLATPDYVAPEILEGSTGDLRSEFYSLGGCLYHAVEGKPPYETEGLELSDLRKIKAQQVRMDRKTPVKQETRELIERMMAPDPDRRFQSCAELELKLLAALKSVGTPEGLWRNGKRRRGRRNGNAQSGVFRLLFGWMSRT
jgi:serine/threonine protein kinase